MYSTQRAFGTAVFVERDRLDRPVRMSGDAGPLGAVLEAAGTIRPGDRLDALGGSLALTSTPGQGATLAGSLPVQIDAAIAG